MALITAPSTERRSPVQTFKLINGFTITAERVGAGIEFVTRNAQGEVTSSVTRGFAESVPLIKRLACRAL
ncbi:hypothetical protein PV343_01320 [Streptomyces sp. WI03-4A]|uniref:hypothetical protein n=1 Tax=Streptomyces sp. WI03-4A TaxID=3028706 RepID=UPI0029B03407|nr:hypothetical protein [Streptomyces sp. WI03-4A]MDX2590964.1 hypothetical protein [Streptomyces sp. WI03-4A]